MYGISDKFYNRWLIAAASNQTHLHIFACYKHDLFDSASPPPINLQSLQAPFQYLTDMTTFILQINLSGTYNSRNFQLKIQNNENIISTQDI